MEHTMYMVTPQVLNIIDTIIRITVSSNQIQSFGLTIGTDTTIHAGGAGYTFGTVNLGSGYTFSDSGLSRVSNMGGSGGAIEVVISPKNGHGNSVIELDGHYVMSHYNFNTK